ncbi:MAG: hypothetical protein KKA19_03185 [Candidatus Margulisbacteria bacterium]|nr:hypothetical protein [Candidatus Margulisiibacteriota bacterium]
MKSGLQAFISGFIGPALIFILFIALFMPAGSSFFIRVYPAYLLPIVWGLWNVLYYYFGRHAVILKKLGVWGAVLGLVTSLSGIFFFNTLAFYKQYITASVTLENVILIEIIIYFILWEVVIRYLNKVLID